MYIHTCASTCIVFVTVGLPLIQSHPHIQIVDNRQHVTFDCFVNGSNSTLNVTWERNKKPYNSGNVANTVYSNGVKQ